VLPSCLLRIASAAADKKYSVISGCGSGQQDYAGHIVESLLWFTGKQELMTSSPDCHQVFQVWQAKVYRQIVSEEITRVPPEKLEQQNPSCPPDIC